jgi:SAM-dependent methyltransferase
MLDNGSAKAARAVGRLASAKQQGGVLGVATEGLRLARRVVVIPVTAVRELAFDLRRGVRTRGEVRHEPELIRVSVGGDARFYQPLYLMQWRQTLDAIPVDPAETTFVDLGAGLGRAVLLAAERGFRRVIGVELDEQLAIQAQDNVRSWRTRRGAKSLPGQEVAIVQGDAATFPLPDEPLVVLLYNPFGETTMRLVLDQLTEQRRLSRHPLYVAYLNPLCEAVFEEFPSLVPSARGRAWVVYRMDPATDGAS